MAVELRVTPYDDEVVRALEERVQAEYVVRCTADRTRPGRRQQFDPPDGVFLVAGPATRPSPAGASVAMTRAP